MNRSFLRFLILLFPLVFDFFPMAQSVLASDLDSFSVTIRESADMDRVAEPVKVSLPFAPGALQEKNQITLFTSDGKAVPAQYEVLARWKDQSIRWLLAHFLIDVPAGGEITLNVRRQPDSSSRSEPDLVRKMDQTFIAGLGPVTIRAGAACKDGFDAMDSAGKSLFVRPPQMIVYAPSGEEYCPEKPNTVELETNGPLYASIFLAGPMKAKQSGFENMFRWETRLHLWKNLPQVLAEHTIVSVKPADGTVTIVDGIVIDFQTARPLSNYAVGGQEETGYEGTLQPNDAVRLEQTCAFWHECFSTRSGPQYIVLEKDLNYSLTRQNASEPIVAGEKAAGWLWCGGTDRSFGVAVRDFWEEGPKALRIAQDGSFGVECYAHWQAKSGQPRPKRDPTPDYSKHPNLDSWLTDNPKDTLQRWLADTGYEGPVRRGPFRFGPGRAKTTDVLYLFGSTENRQNDIRTLRARRNYLIPSVDPAYLAQTRALPLVWTAASDSNLPVFENGLLEAFANWKKHAARYGFLHYGDDQCHWGYNRTIPSTTDDQEYDTAQCLTMQFGRTGLEDYLRWANICARHFMDVDQVQDTGELHYHGYAEGGDYHEESKSCDMQGHPYIGGIVNHYMLTGDRRSLRGINRLAGALSSYGELSRYILKKNERSLVRAGICLAAIYDLTGDPEHLKPFQEVVTAMNDLTGNVSSDLRGNPPFKIWWIHHNEFSHHVREFLVRAHLATQDPRTFDTLKLSCDQYLRDLWDSQKRAWRCFGEGDFNMQYEDPVPREPAVGAYYDEVAASHYGMGFVYLAGITGDTAYLAPFLESLDSLGRDYANNYGNRTFTQCQLWALPMISMLPKSWQEDKGQIVMREVFRAKLNDNDLIAWTPAGSVSGEAHGEVLRQDSPFGSVLRTCRNSFVSFPAPENILEMPGSLCVWVRKDDAQWDSKPWPWYGELRAIIHIGSDRRETNALDIMMLQGKANDKDGAIRNRLWTRMYDNRSWEMFALETENPHWQKQQWHHIAVIWNRFDFSVYLNGEIVSHEDRFALPNGGQTHIWLGWRPFNRYGQADFYDLRLFRSALPDDMVKNIYVASRPR